MGLLDRRTHFDSLGGQLVRLTRSLLAIERLRTGGFRKSSPKEKDDGPEYGWDDGRLFYRLH